MQVGKRGPNGDDIDLGTFEGWADGNEILVRAMTFINETDVKNHKRARKKFGSAIDGEPNFRLAIDIEKSVDADKPYDY
jgi:hypothetical protein